MNSLTLREFESARIANTWDVPSKSVTHSEVALLERHQRTSGRKLFELGYRAIRATCWVGVIGIGDKCIEVIPKIDDANELKARENLLYMVSGAGLVPLAEADIARLSNSGKPLLTAYLELYVAHLTREWRRGQIRCYVAEEQNRTCLKGKLLLPTHLRKNCLQQQYFYTESDEFTPDNALSRILKAALTLCRLQSFSSDIAQKAASLLMDFDEVADVRPDLDGMRHVQLDRRFTRFQPVFNMAKFILKEVAPSAGPKGSRVYSLMFNMNEVFERFIASEIRAAMAGSTMTVKCQVKGRHLLRRDAKNQFALHPDIGIFEGQRSLCMLDTKWKRLDRGRPYDDVSQADIYQMYAYGREYESPRVILLYPQYAGLPHVVADYRHTYDEPARTILVRTINVSEPLSDRKVRIQLRESLRAILDESYCVATSLISG